MDKENRREFLARGGQVIAGTAVAAAAGAALAAGPETAVSVSERRCATCEFWGGVRHQSDDGKSVLGSGQGWCNNPKSPNYKKLTTPDHGPMDTWQKWGALA